MSPSKLELLAEWLPEQPWYVGRGGAPQLTRVGGFRLDDPAGEVGIEFVIVADACGGERTAYCLPMTYRGKPIPSADAALIGTGEHGVLGARWIYDGWRDPVLLEQVKALVSGTVEPQHASQSDTVDPSVTVERRDPTSPIGDLSDAAIDVVRVLTPGEPVGDAIHVLAWVAAPWRGADGTDETGAVVVVSGSGFGSG